MININSRLLFKFSQKTITRFIFVLLCLCLLILSFILFSNYESTKEKLILSIASNFQKRANSLEVELNSVINHVKLTKQMTHRQLSYQPTKLFKETYIKAVSSKKQYYSEKNYSTLETDTIIGEHTILGNIFWIGKNESRLKKNLMMSAINLFSVQAAEQKNNHNII